MKERLDVERPTRASLRDKFENLRPGASWHVETNEERLRILSSFKYWAANIKKVPAKATSLKVDETDPDGVGYRIWFVSTRPKPMPVKPAEENGDDI